MNQTIIGGKNREYNQQQHDQREAKLLKVYEAMLNTNGMSVKEIAVDFGFTNLSTFGKFVKENLGFSPRSYRLTVKNL